MGRPPRSALFLVAAALVSVGPEVVFTPAALLAMPAMYLAHGLSEKRAASKSLTKGVVRRRTLFDRLPCEVASDVFRFLSLQDLTRLSAVSTSLRVIGDAPEVWWLLSRKSGLPLPSSPPPSWKRFYFDRREMLPLQVARPHCSREDCYVVVKGEVYDLTSFLGQHPGGERVILDYAGLDATSVWESFEHSASAAQLMQRYKVPLPTSGAAAEGALACARSKRDAEVARAIRARKARLLAAELFGLPFP